MSKAPTSLGRARSRASTTVLLEKNTFVERKGSYISQDTNSKALTPNSRRKWFFSRQQRNSEKQIIPPEPEKSLTYLKVTTDFFLSTSKKKKRCYKPCEISVTSTRIAFSKPSIQPILLNSLYSLQPAIPETMKRKETKQEVSEEPKTTLVICNEELTRLWINFSTPKECLEWAIILNGLVKFSGRASIIDEEKLDEYIKEVYFHMLLGGTIKVGDMEEWSYIRDLKEMTCILSEGSSITGIKFSFDGRILSPKGNNILGSGEWDGMNIYWYSAGIPDIDDTKQRTKLADMSFHWIPFLDEFRPLHGTNIIDDAFNTWKWARVFLARKKQSSHDWVQKEGEVPLPISMFLVMHKWASVTEPPPIQVLEDTDSDEE